MVLRMSWFNPWGEIKAVRAAYASVADRRWRYGQQRERARETLEQIAFGDLERDKMRALARVGLHQMAELNGAKAKT
jgi:hypothetical protein